MRRKNVPLVQADTPPQILKSWVSAQIFILGRDIQPDHGVGVFLVALRDPLEGPVAVSHPELDICYLLGRYVALAR